MTMTAGITPNAARKPARDRAAKLLDDEDAERRRQEAAKKKRILDNVAEIAANDAEIGQLTKKIEDLHADTGRRLAAIIADNVSEPLAAAMTEREVRDVKAAVRAGATKKAPAKATKKSAAAKAAVAESAAA